MDVRGGGQWSGLGKLERFRLVGGGGVGGERDSFEPRICAVM